MPSNKQGSQSIVWVIIGC
uniref:Uncharacterized protein n=1 Tax=Anguilla anguilla TaxID=7936 RepID=A0A0E9VMP6_ANGAN